MKTMGERLCHCENLLAHARSSLRFDCTGNKNWLTTVQRIDRYFDQKLEDEQRMVVTPESSPRLRCLQNVYARLRGKPEPWPEKDTMFKVPYSAGRVDGKPVYGQVEFDPFSAFYEGTGYHPPLRSKRLNDVFQKLNQVVVELQTLGYL